MKIISLLLIVFIPINCFAVPTELITSVFIPDPTYNYTSTTDPKIASDVKWFLEHGMASVPASANQLTIGYTTADKNIIEAIALAHKNSNLYYSLSLAESISSSCNPAYKAPGSDICLEIRYDDICTPERWAIIKPEMVASGIAAYDDWVSRGAVPGRDGSYYFYMETEGSTSMMGGSSWYGQRYRELYAEIINHIYPEMPNPGTNKMIIFISPYTYIGSCGATYISNLRTWAESLATAVNLSSRAPNLKLVIMTQDLVGQNASYRPGGADRLAILSCLSDYYTALTTTSSGTNIVAKINAELFGNDINACPVSWSRIETQISEENAYSEYGIGASWAWYTYCESHIAFMNSYHLYYYGPTQAITFMSN